MSGGLVVVAQLFIAPGHDRDFEEYEAKAAEIIARHGGRIERRADVRRDGDPDRPDEVHVVSFPSRASFDAYREDPKLRSLGELRARAIHRTVVWVDGEAALRTLRAGNSEMG